MGCKTMRPLYSHDLHLELAIHYKKSIHFHECFYNVYFLSLSQGLFRLPWPVLLIF